MNSIIKLDKVSKSYAIGQQKTDVLHQIDLDIHPGEFVAIVGASGSGKTTSMNIMGLLDRPTSGKYWLTGTDTSALNAQQQAHLRNQHIGFIFQLFFLLPRLSALQNVSLPLLYRHANLHERKIKGMEILEKVGMAPYWRHHPNKLSGGQQQRVAIARALIGSPKIILADEPTGALDQDTGRSIMDLLKKVNQEDGTTIVIITHDNQIAHDCQRIYRMNGGKMIESSNHIKSHRANGANFTPTEQTVGDESPRTTSEIC